MKGPLEGSTNPIYYKIYLQPDLKNFQFSGIIELMVEAIQPIKEVTLNAKELVVLYCALEKGSKFINCPFSLNPEKEEVTITLPESLSGTIKLNIHYQGEINNKMIGFYRSGYKINGEMKHIVVTQFQENDARRAFPCFDHPSKKATFDLKIVVDEGLIAISNSTIQIEKELEKGKKLVIFNTTPKMSSYLLFFGIGEFEFLEDHYGKFAIRIATLPKKKKYAKFSLAFSRKALEFCEDYYNVEYPLAKLDLIAIPDFAAGAMENWGAITFRENLLLHYPGITSRAEEERICEVIAHEIAHQWFGNLVTPSDWKYLWLNESFATYFGYMVLNHYYPEWEVWDQFLDNETDHALVHDALLQTYPIELPDEKPQAINVCTSPIIYDKGASILRQVEGYMGEDSFKEGVRFYLKKYSYSCASSQDFWTAFEEISGSPIVRMMKSWIKQPGYPLLEVRREGNYLIFTQSRFSYLPGEFNQQWLIPLNVKVFYLDNRENLIAALMEEKHLRINIGERAVAYKVNYGQTGFYRVKYHQKENLDELLKLVFSKRLSPVDRWGLQNDFYALWQRGDVSINDYLNLLSYFSEEDAFLPLNSIVKNLFHTYLVIEGGKKEKVAEIGRSFCENALFRIGFEPENSERYPFSILRNQIIYPAILFDSKIVQEFAFQKFSALMKGKTVHKDLLKSVMQAGAWKGDEDVFNWLDNKFKASVSEDERINILRAFGCFRDERTIKKVLKYILEDVPERNRFILVSSLTTNPYTIPYMWDWYLENKNELEKLHPDHYERIIEAIVPICGLTREEEVKHYFIQYKPKEESTREVIKLSLEKLEINLRMRYFL